MITYYFIFAILSFLAFQEINNPKPLKKFSFIYLTLLFSFFIGLRNEIGCDWQGYKTIYDLSDCTFNTENDLCTKYNIYSIFDYLKFKEIGFSFINFIIYRIGGNFYLANFIFSLLFIIPTLLFCSKLKRPFLGILVSYPYLITVIGLGTIRQSIAIAFLMLGFNALNNKQFIKYYLLNFIGIIFHYSSSIFIFLPLLIVNKVSNNLKIIKKILFFLFFLLCSLFLVFNDNYFTNQMNGYLYYIKPVSIKSPLIIWIITAVPSTIILFNYKDLKDNDPYKFWMNYSIVDILMLLPIFLNTIIALRLLLYFLPIKIYALSNLPQLKIFQKSPKNAYLMVITISFFILTIWLNFANHSYCYLPYKNLLLRQL